MVSNRVLRFLPWHLGPEIRSHGGQAPKGQVDDAQSFLAMRNRNSTQRWSQRPPYRWFGCLLTAAKSVA